MRVTAGARSARLSAGAVLTSPRAVLPRAGAVLRARTILTRPIGARTEWRLPVLPGTVLPGTRLPRAELARPGPGLTRRVLPRPRVARPVLVPTWVARAAGLLTGPVRSVVFLT